MDVRHCVCWLYICVRLNGGNGINVRSRNPVESSSFNSFQGSDQRRSVPLGVRICTKKPTKVPELYYGYGYNVSTFEPRNILTRDRLDLCYGMADRYCQRRVSSWNTNSRLISLELRILRISTMAWNSACHSRCLFLHHLQYCRCQAITNG